MQRKFANKKWGRHLICLPLIFVLTEKIFFDIIFIENEWKEIYGWYRNGHFIWTK